MKKVFIILGIILLSIMMSSCGKKYEIYEDSDIMPKKSSNFLVPADACSEAILSFQELIDMIKNEENRLMKYEPQNIYQVVGYYEDDKLDEFKNIKWYKFENNEDIPLEIEKKDKKEHYYVVEAKVTDALNGENFKIKNYVSSKQIDIASKKFIYLFDGSHFYFDDYYKKENGDIHTLSFMSYLNCPNSLMISIIEEDEKEFLKICLGKKDDTKETKTDFGVFEEKIYDMIYKKENEKDTKYSFENVYGYCESGKFINMIKEYVDE